MALYEETKEILLDGDKLRTDLCLQKVRLLKKKGASCII